MLLKQIACWPEKFRPAFDIEKQRALESSREPESPTCISKRHFSDLQKVRKTIPRGLYSPSSSFFRFVKEFRFFDATIAKKAEGLGKPGVLFRRVCHYRLFNHLLMNGKDQPLVSMDIVVDLIENTRSQT